MRNVLRGFVFIFCAGFLFAGVGVEVSPNSWHAGTGGAGEYKSSGGACQVKNIGTDPAKVSIRATNTQNWSLQSSPGLDSFSMEQSKDGTTWTPIQTGDAELVSPLAADAIYNFDLCFKSPTDITDKALTQTQYSTITISVEPAIIIATEYEISHKWNIAQINGAAGMGIDTSGNIYVTCYTGQHRIQVFSKDGILLSEWGSTGSAPGEFNQPLDVEVDGNGNIYVADAGNSRVQKFDANHNYILEFSPPNGARGIAIDKENNVIVCSNTSMVYKFSPTGELIYGINVSGNYAADVAVDRDNRMYFLISPPCIKIYNKDGNYISSWASEGEMEMFYAAGLDISNQDEVFICDTGNARMQKYDLEGNFITSWGGWDIFSSNEDVKVDSSGNVYVVDPSRGAITVFKPKY